MPGGAAAGGAGGGPTFSDDGKWVDDKATFLTVVAWERLGENCVESLTKGTEVIVTGRLEQREYETKEGEKRTVFEIIADSVGVSLARASVKVTKATRQAQGSDLWQSQEAPF